MWNDIAVYIWGQGESGVLFQCLGQVQVHMATVCSFSSILEEIFDYLVEYSDKHSVFVEPLKTRLLSLIEDSNWSYGPPLTLLNPIHHDGEMEIILISAMHFVSIVIEHFVVVNIEALHGVIFNVIELFY